MRYSREKIEKLLLNCTRLDKKVNIALIDLLGVDMNDGKWQQFFEENQLTIDELDVFAISSTIPYQTCETALVMMCRDGNKESANILIRAYNNALISWANEIWETHGFLKNDFSRSVDDVFTELQLEFLEEIKKKKGDEYSYDLSRGINCGTYLRTNLPRSYAYRKKQEYNSKWMIKDSDVDAYADKVVEWMSNNNKATLETNEDFDACAEAVIRKNIDHRSKVKKLKRIYKKMQLKPTIIQLDEKIHQIPTYDIYDFDDYYHEKLDDDERYVREKFRKTVGDMECDIVYLRRGMHEEFFGEEKTYEEIKQYILDKYGKLLSTTTIGRRYEAAKKKIWASCKYAN